MENVNVVVITGNLTQDPELRHIGSGTAVCDLRIAVNTRRKTQAGSWQDKPNYFNVVVWGARGENCAEYLAKGSKVAIHGRLEWREWEAKDGSGKRQAVQIVAETVEFLTYKRSDSETASQSAAETEPELPGVDRELAGVGAGSEEEIPF